MTIFGTAIVTNPKNNPFNTMKSYLRFLSRNKLYTAIMAVGLNVALALVIPLVSRGGEEGIGPRHLNRCYPMR